MSEIFQAIADESQFTKEILGSGITQIGKANYAQKGIYFLAFTAISTGLERIGKLCLILDYYIDNNGSFPNDKFVKKDIGHDLIKIYNKSQDIIHKRDIKFEFHSKIGDPIQIEILSILSKFAKGDRYSNIDFLVSSSHRSDPIKEWNKKVDKNLFEVRVSKLKKEKIRNNAKIIGSIMSPFTIVRHSSESRDEITDVENASFLTGMTESISKYRQLYILQIVRYWVEILSALEYKAMSFKNEDIPFMSEIFAIFNNIDSYFLTRKTYDKN